MNLISLRSRVPRWVLPPEFENDEDKTRIARLLHVIVMTLLVIAIIYVGVSPFLETNLRVGLVANSLTIVFYVIILHLNRIGRIRLASVAFSALFWMAVTGIAIAYGGAATPAYLSYFTCIAVVGLLLGGRSALICAALSTAASLGVAWLDMQHKLPPAVLTTTPLSMWWIATVNYIMVAVLLHLTVEGMMNALARTRREIGVRRRVEEALIDSNQRLQVIIQGTPVILFSTDRTGVFTLCEGKVFGQIGFEPRTLVGISLFDMFAGTIPQIRDKFEEALSGKEVISIEEWGGLTFEIRYAPNRSRQGEITGVAGIAVDITDRKQALDALRASEDKYRNLVNSLDECVFIIDTQGILRFSNPAVKHVAGYTPEEVVGRSFVEFTHPDDLPWMLEYFQRALQSEAWENTLPVPGITEEFEGRFLTRTGESVWTAMKGSPIRDATGTITGFYGLARNISVHKRLETERVALIKELESKNAELERFTYTVSHDLKSPLITIQGFLGFLEKDALSGDTDRLKTDLNHISQAASNMQRLLEDLLELSRIGRVVNPPQEIPFELIAQEAVEVVRVQIDRRGVQVRIAARLPVVLGDRMRLVEAVQNLVDNATKFMGEQADPCIDIGWRSEGEQGVFFIRDNGIGIDPRYHDKIFGLFDKLDGQSEGSGIGLTLVKRIVEVHGGHIWVESAGPGTGSTLCFTLPILGEQQEQLNS